MHVKLMATYELQIKDTFVLISEEDVPLIKKYRWHMAGRYARTSAGAMHRIIVENGLRKLERGEVVDHIDRNTLNNTRENLRIATVSQNVKNSARRRAPKNRPFKSKYKGVYFVKGRWYTAKVNWPFETEIDAKRAYDAISSIIYGEFHTPEPD